MSTTYETAWEQCTSLMPLKESTRTVQELLGHKDVKTTMIYTHVLNRGGRGVIIPLESVA